MPLVHRERHRTSHIGWLRASVLGANDGIVSTASLMVGIAAANTARADVLVAGVAALVAGAMAMAAGEYVSVSSQADTERADLAKERHELDTAKDHELQELADIYIALPLLTVLWMPQRLMVVGVSVTSLFFLTVLGALSARAGGAPIVKAAFRVTAWGAFALAATAGVGMLFGARA
ncbi:MAG: hypothetical protein B7Y03_10200 [Polaromonas sp. 24-62-144]|nr:MAG: hypothetical protein B7Y03_10200 [Polaromonas sp. 24-62-144]